MATFAITRQDGEVDLAEGASVEDISNRYGWPGNGDIKPWDGDTTNVRHRFTDPDNQRELLADKPKGKAAFKSEGEK